MPVRKVFPKRARAKKNFKRWASGLKKKPITRPRYMSRGSDQVQFLKARVNYSLKKSDFANLPDGSMYNVQYQCPWQNVSATTTNRCYSKDFENMIGNNSSVIAPLFQQYKVTCIVYEYRRPKIAATGTDNVFQPTTLCGTQICHGREVYTPNGSVGVVEPVATLVPKVIHSHPSSWSESVDNLSSQFHLHGYRSSFKRVWKPATSYERRWRNYTNGDRELATGSMYVAFKDQVGVPDRAGTTIHEDTILLEVTATIYMSFKKRL